MGRQHTQFMDGGYYDDDIDTDDYRRGRGYAQHSNLNDMDKDNESDWSEDEQLGVIQSDCNQMDIDKDKKKKKKKKHKKKKQKKKKKDKNVQYDISVNDVDSMPIQSDNVEMNDAVEVVVDKEDQNEEEEEEEEENQTLQTDEEDEEEQSD